MLAHRAVPSPELDLAPLEAFPWLVHADPAPPAAHNASRKTGQGSSRKLIDAGIAVAFAALCGGAFSLAGGPIEEPAPAVQMASPPQTGAAAALWAEAGAGAADSATGGAALIAEPADSEREASAVAEKPKLAARMPAPAPRIDPSPAEEPALATDAATVVAPPAPAPPVADSPASAATLEAYRSAMDESRATVREVIRLGSRQRPPRDASAEEQTGYRLRQQNAAAARDYRNYLDRLARSMRGTKSEAVALQSLERARQTLGYLTTMLADSKASLR